MKFVFPSTMNCNMLSIILTLTEMYVILKCFKHSLGIKFSQSRTEKICNISLRCKFCSDNLKFVMHKFEERKSIYLFVIHTHTHTHTHKARQVICTVKYADGLMLLVKL